MILSRCAYTLWVMRIEMENRTAFCAGSAGYFSSSGGHLLLSCGMRRRGAPGSINVRLSGDSGFISLYGVMRIYREFRLVCPTRALGLPGHAPLIRHTRAGRRGGSDGVYRGLSGRGALHRVAVSRRLDRPGGGSAYALLLRQRRAGLRNVGGGSWYAAQCRRRLAAASRALDILPAAGMYSGGRLAAKAAPFARQ